MNEIERLKRLNEVLGTLDRTSKDLRPERVSWLGVRALRVLSRILLFCMDRRWYRCTYALARVTQRVVEAEAAA